MRPRIFVPVAVVLGALGVGGLVLYSPNHSACSSFLVQATNESLCRTDSTMYIISWALITVAIFITLGQIASLTQSRNSTSDGSQTPNKKYCVSCGKPMAINSAFCPQCGAVVKANSTFDAETPQVKKRPREATDTEVITVTEPLSTQDPVDSGPKARHRTSRKFFLVLTAVVLVLIVSSVVVLTIRSHHTNGLSSSLISERLPLHVCKTSLGLSTMKPANLPSHENEMVPPGLAGTLVIYSDSMGIMKLLGPPGWGCSAAVGADGSGGVTITPTKSGIRTNSDGALSADSTVEEINGSQTGGATGQALSQACSLFAAAQKRWDVNGQKCYPTKPASEQVLRLNQNSVEFIDSPHVHGNGYPSGGAYSATGVVTFYPHSWQEPQSWIETCVLPPNEQSICSATLSNFVSAYGK